MTPAPALGIGLLGSAHASSGTLLGSSTKSLRPPRGLGEFVSMAPRSGSATPVAPEPLARGPLRFISASASRQHPIKRDAGYVYADAVARAPRLLGVCDGVSGVQQLGLNPDELPRQLLEECSKAMDHCIAADEVPRDGDGHWLMTLLQEAYDRTEVWGATTVLLAAMEDSRRLVVANVGDCGLLVLRPEPSCPSRLTRQFRTDELRYEANRPVQVMRLANTRPEESHLVIQGARMNTVNCHRGDLVVLGSDGIFDNLRDEEIAAIVERHCGAPKPGKDGAFALEPPSRPGSAEFAGDWPAPSVSQLEDAASALVDAAIRNVRIDALEQNTEEPPWEASRREKPGGNADDTTAIVALVVEADDLVKADFEEPIQVPRETFRVCNRRVLAANGPDAPGGAAWAGGGLLGFAGIIPQCCHTSAAQGDEFEESLLCKEPKIFSHCKPRKETDAEVGESEQCTIS